MAVSVQSGSRQALTALDRIRRMEIAMIRSTFMNWNETMRPVTGI